MVQVARTADGKGCAITVRSNAALPRRGTGVLCGLAAGLAGSACALLVHPGAWPVGVFLLAAVAALLAALLRLRRRRGGYERLAIHDRLLRWERHAGEGTHPGHAGHRAADGHSATERDEVREVNASWVSIVPPDRRLPYDRRHGITLRAHGEDWRFGQELSAAERRQVETTLRRMLARRAPGGAPPCP